MELPNLPKLIIFGDGGLFLDFPIPPSAKEVGLFLPGRVAKVDLDQP